MNIDIFAEGLKKYGFNPEKETIDKFFVYSSLLKEWNEKMNLTAITDDDGISVKHFLDSLSPLGLIKNGSDLKIIDIGTGAGFPGLPLKIMREDLSLTLLDSLNKRIIFLNEVTEKLGLENVEALHGRAEDFGKNQKYREKYDYAFSRAVASLKVLSEYCLPFVKTGGFFIALKSSEIEEELSEAKAMIGSLGGKITEIKEIEIPCSDLKRKIVVIEKVKATPKEFPRTNKKIKGDK